MLLKISLIGKLLISDLKILYKYLLFAIQSTKNMVILKGQRREVGTHMKLLLTRHGQTDWNVQGRIQGQSDIELNQTGIEQAKATGEKLKEQNIDIIISSPLKRATKTAQLIAGTRDIPIIYDKRIVERCFGEFEGKTREEFDFEEIWNYKLNKQYEQAESVGEIFDRVYQFLDALKEEYQDKTVLLVTHGGIIVPVRVYCEGMPEGMEVLRGLGIGNCEVKEYDL